MTVTPGYQPFTVVPALTARIPAATAVVADKGYDSEKQREQISANGSVAVIPRRRKSTKGNAEMDGGLYNYRHLVENAFAKLKHFRAIATRHDKLKRNHLSYPVVTHTHTH